MADNKKSFTLFINESNLEGSGKASSYIQALNWLSKMLQYRPFDFEDCIDIWNLSSLERAYELYEFVLSETRKGDNSEWNIKDIPKSYLQKGYCSAALKSYQEFLVSHNYEAELFDIFLRHEEFEAGLADKMNLDFNYPDYLLSGLDKKEGKEVVRSIKTRSNQNVFRKIILGIYNQSCCITGLNIPEINRASHIVPWSENKNLRLDPKNGLCLSATYDAAFDRNLISLDDDYRIIVSRNIREYYLNKSVNKYFKQYEGKKITLPSSYYPQKEYLADHRAKGSF